MLEKNIEGKYGPDINLDYSKVLEALQGRKKLYLFPHVSTTLANGSNSLSDDWSNPDLRLKSDIKYFPDMVHYMDVLMEDFFDEGKGVELYDDTMVIFYSDNGTTYDHESVPRQQVQGGKALTTQTGIRVPLIVQWPKVIQAGSVNRNLIDASDFLPTLAELANIEIPTIGSMMESALLVNYYNYPLQLESIVSFGMTPGPGWDKEKFSVISLPSIKITSCLVTVVFMTSKEMAFMKLD